MLRGILNVTRQTKAGKILALSFVSSFLISCGTSLGPVAIPDAPNLSLPGFSAPSLASFGVGQRSTESSGVIAAPGTEWGFINEASDEYLGLVVADEPRAALMARRILADGGTAADAAAALFFTLTATNPAAASLGAGGVCLVHDARTGVAQSVDFLPRAPRQSGPIAVPGAVRGLAYIQSEYGRLSWEDVVSPSQAIADRHPMSATLARRVDVSNGPAASNSRLRRVFADRTGAPLSEGDVLAQSDLAGTLGIIANRGPQDLYTGELAYRFVEEAAEVGGTLTTFDMQSYSPNILTAQVVELPGEVAFVPAGATGAGFFFPELAQKSLRGLPSNPMPGQPGVNEIRQDALDVLGESGITGTLPADYGSTSFAITDATGLTVVCGLTMNGAFGSGIMGRSTGLIYARSPNNIEYGLSGAFLTPIITTNMQANRLHVAAAGSGGPAAAASLLYTAMNARTVGLEQALSTNGSGVSDTVNAISCGREEGDAGRVCRIGVDPRGSGLGAEALD